MKKLMILISLALFFLISMPSAGQSPCSRLISEGDSCFNKKIPDFQCSVDKYVAALIVCPELLELSRDRIQQVFTKVEGLRKQAEIDRQLARKAQEELANKKAIAEKEVILNAKLIGAFYFYDDSLALAHNGRRFGYVDKTGRALIHYKFGRASVFESPGFAKVELNGKEYLLSTSGSAYLASYGIDDIDSQIEALAIDRVAVSEIKNKINSSLGLKMLILRNVSMNNDSSLAHEAVEEVEHWVLDDGLASPELELLSLWHSPLDSVSPEVGKLIKLERLLIRESRIRSLPSEIGRLSALTWLYLGYNRLNGLPPEIGRLSRLTKLNLYHNLLSSIPPEIGALSSLTGLDLGRNALTSIPREIGMLSSLSELYLGNNRLTELPGEIGLLSKLEHLHLNENQLSGLPPEIGMLSALKILKLGGNQLTSLPDEMGKLSSLTELYLERNKLKEIPEEIFKLKMISKIVLTENEITILPIRIEQLKNLEELWIGDNPCCNTSVKQQLIYKQMQLWLPNCQVHFN